MPSTTLRSGFGTHLLLLGLALGCDGAGEAASTAPGAEAGESSLAIVDGAPIPTRAIDLPLQLDLYDLEFAKYQRRREQLERVISERLGSDVSPDSAEWKRRVEVRLKPPPPPRLEIPDAGAPIRGDAGAAVTIVEFVDFESPHCRRLQPELARILERYPERVRLLTRDLPLPYHRYARNAAHAAHCAGEQGAYWAFYDLLLLGQPKLTSADLERYAAQLGLDSGPFEACIQSGRHADRISADAALAARLGVRRAGTLFVNGLYLMGHPGYADIERVVRGELARLRLDAARPREASDMPAHAFQAERSARSPAADSAARPALPEIPASFFDEAEAVVILSRAEVDRALRDRERLDRKLEASPGEFSGQRLLKIRKVDGGDFYARLGLEAGDVPIIVNGEFNTVENPVFWEAFEVGERVTIVVMRRGLPHTYEYRIR